MKDNYPASRRTGHMDMLEYAERERLFDKGLTRDQMNDLMRRLQEHMGSKNKLAREIFNRPNAASRIKQLVEGGARYTDNTIENILALAKRTNIPVIPSVDDATTTEFASTADTPNDQSSPKAAIAEEADMVVAENGMAAAASEDRPSDESAENAPLGRVPHQTAPEEVSSREADVIDAHDEGHGAAVDGMTDLEPSNPAAAFVEDLDRVATEPQPNPVGVNDDWLHGVNMRRDEIKAGMEGLSQSIDERREAMRLMSMEIEDLERRRESAANSLDDIDRALAILHTI